MAAILSKVKNSKFSLCTGFIEFITLLACAACRVNQFRCTNGQCISACKRCDERSDCDDNSDESGCCKSIMLCRLRIQPRPLVGHAACALTRPLASFPGPSGGGLQLLRSPCSSALHCLPITILSARQHMLQRAICYRPSIVRLSVRQDG